MSFFTKLTLTRCQEAVEKALFSSLKLTLTEASLWQLRALFSSERANNEVLQRGQRQLKSTSDAFLIFSLSATLILYNLARLAMRGTRQIAHILCRQARVSNTVDS